MKLKRLKEDAFSICITDEEFRAIYNSLREVREAIDDFEFFARIGTTKIQIEEISTQMREHMESEQFDL